MLSNMFMVYCAKSFAVTAQLSEIFVQLSKAFISGYFNIHTLTHTITKVRAIG